MCDEDGTCGRMMMRLLRGARMRRVLMMITVNTARRV